MKRSLPYLTCSLLMVLGLGSRLGAADPVTTSKPTGPDLAEFRTVETAITAQVSRRNAGSAGQTGYLGISVKGESTGKVLLAEVGEDSPAARAGLKRGDTLLRLDGQPVPNPEDLRRILQDKAPGETVRIALQRGEKPLEVVAMLAATSRPMKPSTEPVSLGLLPGRSMDDEGVPVGQVMEGTPAAKAGVKAGDLMLKIDGSPLTGISRLGDTLSEKRPGDKVALTVRREGKEIDFQVELIADRGFGRFGGGRQGQPGWDTRAPTLWKKDVYRMAAVCVEFPDAKHNPQITNRDWEEALFSQKSYVNKANVTGQTVYGSMNDYYHELSYGGFRVEGKVFDWVEVIKKRADYSQGTGTGNRTVLLGEALDRLLERDGKDALKDFDGVFFLYAGERVQTTRGGLYWPHKGNLRHQGKSWAYYICPEGGRRMNNISVICHEFGHMLGLPDLYARPENPGSEGVGVWCAMSQQNPNGRPQHFSAWCKEQLGWLKPAVIDPTVKQKLILSPVEDSPTECLKVLIRPDGSEYLLLENRRKKGFDRDLPAEGLLIWHIVGNRPILEEAHGVEGPSGPRVFMGSVPYPSPANNAFTPYTTPSSRSQLGGGLPVHITNIRRLADGRVTFYMGYEFQ